jgi:hypothetical protein
MAKSKVTVEEYLADLGFKAEEITALSPQFQSRVDKINEGYMRQSDYDRAMNETKAELTQSQNDLAAAQERLNAEMAEWATLTAAEKANATRQRADFEKAQQDVLRLQQVVERVATDAGLDPKKVLADTTITTPAPKAPSLDGFVKAEDLDRLVNERIGGFASGMLNLTPELMQIAREHEQLFGTPLDSREIVRELQSRAGTKGNQKSLDPRDIWNDLHKVTDKREATAKAKYDSDLAAAEERGRAAARSEMMIPGSTAAPGHRSVIFAGEKGRTSVLNRPQPGETVGKAAAAFRTGTYRKEGAAAKR